MAKKKSLTRVPVSEPRMPLQTGKKKADREELDPTNEGLLQTATAAHSIFDRTVAEQALEVLVPLLKRQSCMGLYIRIRAYLDNEPIKADEIETANKKARYVIEKYSSDSTVAIWFEERAKQASEVQKRHRGTSDAASVETITLFDLWSLCKGMRVKTSTVRGWPYQTGFPNACDKSGRTFTYPKEEVIEWVRLKKGKNIKLSLGAQTVQVVGASNSTSLSKEA